MLPSGIVFVNDYMSDQVRDTLVTQLAISSVLTGAEYDAIINADPTFPDTVHNNCLRIMVIRNYQELTNRETADVVLFFSNGMISVEENNFGPPGNTFKASDISWAKIGIFHI